MATRSRETEDRRATPQYESRNLLICDDQIFGRDPDILRDLP
jgi:hypothetical protein